MTVKGIKNIKQELRLDFYKKSVDKNFDPTKYRIKAIYGENGSGKSAIITAVKIFHDLFFRDNYLSESETQEFLNEIINKEMHEFSFECEIDKSMSFKDFVSIIFKFFFPLSRFIKLRSIKFNN